ncbi:MAG: tetratricopeptide repeat protein [Acidobacteria bacterium]|jgi:Tfp pilus assembly protein PilF|nr:tetratricopeptide repeat protein [Acidobacteriota bacterium]
MKTIKLITIIIFSILVITGCGGNKEVKSSPGQLKRGTAAYDLNEALYYLNAGDFKSAEPKLVAALKKDPNLVNAVNALGIVYLNKRDFDNAVKQFRRVIQLNSKYYDAYNYLGVIFIETGKYELAKENLLIAANAETYRTPENAYANLATLELNNNKLDSALRYAEKGLEKNKNFAPLYNLRGIIYENRKEYREAINNFEKALSLLTEDDATILVNIGRTYAKMGDKKKALDILEKALPKTGTPELKNQIITTIKELEK